MSKKKKPGSTFIIEGNKATKVGTMVKIVGEAPETLKIKDNELNDVLVLLDHDNRDALTVFSEEIAKHFKELTPEQQAKTRETIATLKLGSNNEKKSAMEYLKYVSNRNNECCNSRVNNKI